mmetsp:Transcript_98274/g.174156  ORF Transcript_98274/g.174156 Transcript_98274/m.174156 type:complete len:201 (+) Transcript_98274:87-689(+)
MKRPADEQLTKESSTTETPAGAVAEAPAEASAETSAEAPEVKVVKSSQDFWQVQVEAIYRRRNPLKLGGVEALLQKYKGKEAILYAKVCKTYDLDPTQFYTDDEAWKPYEKDVQDEASASGAAESSQGGGVAIPNLFGPPPLFQGSSGSSSATSGLFSSTPIFQAKPSGSAADADSSDDDEPAVAKTSSAKPAQAECKTQ